MLQRHVRSSHDRRRILLSQGIRRISSIIVLVQCYSPCLTPAAAPTSRFTLAKLSVVARRHLGRQPSDMADLGLVSEQNVEDGVTYGYAYRSWVRSQGLIRLGCTGCAVQSRTCHAEKAALAPPSIPLQARTIALTSAAVHRVLPMRPFPRFRSSPTLHPTYLTARIGSPCQLTDTWRR